MHRRAFLAAGTGALATLAGCSFGAVGSPEPLGPPASEEEADGTRYYDFERAGEHALDIDLAVPGSRPSADAPAGVVLEVTPYGGLRTSEVRWELRAPPGKPPGTARARVFATTTSAGAVQVERAAGGATAVVADGVSSRSTLVVRARVVPRDPVEELAVRVATVLNGEGGPYSATVDGTLALPVRD